MWLHAHGVGGLRTIWWILPDVGAPGDAGTREVMMAHVNVMNQSKMWYAQGNVV